MFGKLLFVGMVGFISPSAVAEFSQAKLNCASASGETLLEARIPGDSDESRISLTLEALSPQPKVIHYLNRAMLESEELNGQEPSEVFRLYRESIIASINSETIKALMISVLEINDYNLTVLTLVAKPETLQLESKGSRTLGTFQAELMGPRDPRREGFSTPTLLTCSYDYSN